VREHGRGLRVDPGGQVVQQQVVDVAREVADAVPIGDHLVVGDHDEDLDPGALESDAVGQVPK